ncbi:MAG: hypothetical protein Greene041619_634 [Candidatus Peregrinibacteria bacterium Greene0416_19]|nr:MAG: hypothetical protein Greene041619_634 [Candidatus Peregrinibacteria bacterium Greene0416_19]
MNQPSVITPGSLDIETVSLRIGVVDTHPLAELISKGNKFVVAEHFVDQAGNPLDDLQFDAQRMCYSLFVAPIPITGRHSQVIPHNRIRITGRTGHIVGGGVLDVGNNNSMALDDYSGDYMQEPPMIRQRLMAMLLPILRERFSQPALRLRQYASAEDAGALYTDFTNVYWLRFRQVLEALKQQDEWAADARIRRYQYSEEERVRCLINVAQTPTHSQ